MEIVRKSISFPKDLADKIAERAKRDNRSFSAQIVFDMNHMLNMMAPPSWLNDKESRIEEEK